MWDWNAVGIVIYLWFQIGKSWFPVYLIFSALLHLTENFGAKVASQMHIAYLSCTKLMHNPQSSPNCYSVVYCAESNYGAQSPDAQPKLKRKHRIWIVYNQVIVNTMGRNACAFSRLHDTHLLIVLIQVLIDFLKLIYLAIKTLFLSCSCNSHLWSLVTTLQLK